MYLKNLSIFYKIIDFREIEILIDSYGYKAIRSGNKVIIEPTNEILEKSIELGYIKTDTQNSADLFHLHTDISSLDNSLVYFVIQLSLKCKEQLFFLEEKPYKRIVMKFPIIKELFNRNELFTEEIIAIKQIEKNLFINFDQILQISIFKNICLFDIIKIQRLFNVLIFAFFAYLESQEQINSKLFWRSIIPIFDKISFIKVLEELFGQPKAEQLLDLLSWNPSSNKIFDIQYQPIISFDNSIILPLGIVSNSNLIRNSLQYTKYRFDSDDSNDPIGELLENALKSVSYFVQKNVSYSYKKIKGEIDVIAIIENRIFVFECKNSLHPTSLFELRTSYDYIKKAAKQLIDFQTLWKEEDFRNDICTRLNFSIPTQIYPCIVTGNRMFCGWQEQGINVRPIYEMLNVINTGKISFKEFDINEQRLEGITFNLWSQDTFNVNDLIDYINNNSIYQCYFSSMVNLPKDIRIGKISIIKNRYALDVKNLIQEAYSKFRLVDN